MVSRKKNKIDSSVKLGGICGAIAVTATIFEVILNGATADAIAEGIKDIAETMVSVLLLASAWLALHPHKNRHFDFQKEFEERLVQWQLEHKNMISTSGNLYDLYMKINVENFFSAGSTNKKGRFVIINMEDTMTLTFSLNKGLFVGTGISDSWKEEVDYIGDTIRKYANERYAEFAEIRYDKSSKNIIFILKKTPNTEAELDKILEILSTMYQAFLVCASTKK